MPEMELIRPSFGPNSGPSRREPMIKPKNRIPPGPIYLIVDELDGRGMNSVSQHVDLQRRDDWHLHRMPFASY